MAGSRKSTQLHILRPDLYQPDPFANIGKFEDRTILKGEEYVNFGS
jgi:hypothetical protein